MSVKQVHRPGRGSSTDVFIGLVHGVRLAGTARTQQSRRRVPDGSASMLKVLTASGDVSAHAAFRSPVWGAAGTNAAI
jgi:hypothetical protein